MTIERLKELESLVENRLYEYWYRRGREEADNYEPLEKEDVEDLLSLISDEKRRQIEKETE